MSNGKGGQNNPNKPNNPAPPPVTSGPGTILYPQIQGYLPSGSPGYFNIQTSFTLDGTKTYQLQTSLDGGSTWAPPEGVPPIAPGTLFFSWNIQVPLGQPVRVVEQ